MARASQKDKRDRRYSLGVLQVNQDQVEEMTELLSIPNYQGCGP